MTPSHTLRDPTNTGVASTPQDPIWSDWLSLAVPSYIHLWDFSLSTPSLVMPSFLKKSLTNKRIFSFKSAHFSIMTPLPEPVSHKSAKISTSSLRSFSIRSKTSTLRCSQRNLSNNMESQSTSLTQVSFQESRTASSTLHMAINLSLLLLFRILLIRYIKSSLNLRCHTATSRFADSRPMALLLWFPMINSSPLSSSIAPNKLTRTIFLSQWSSIWMKTTKSTSSRKRSL